jgi:phenol hydroxylase P2 protein
MSKVYIALQDNEESHYIVEAIEEDNPDVTVIYQPAMIRIECEGHMVIKRETVEEKMLANTGPASQPDHAGW